MAIEAFNIRVAEHLADLVCVCGKKDGQDCDWKQNDVNVNTSSVVKYGKKRVNREMVTDKNYISMVCPNCGEITTYPTFDPKNRPGHELGQAKTEPAE